MLTPSYSQYADGSIPMSELSVGHGGFTQEWAASQGELNLDFRVSAVPSGSADTPVFHNSDGSWLFNGQEVNTK